MGKFTDPNYYLLKQYFDQLLEVRNGVQKSYLIGPNKTVVSEGGVYSILYENHPERGYVGHRFKIVEIDGNRFKMTYEGLESNFQIETLDSITTSAELSAFGIGNEMYFRKDSFFHYWLARPTQDDSFHDYANQERTFLFFGKIWPTSNSTNTYAIEFEGMKDYTLRAIPQHQQTVNMTEWLKVYFDQIHHEQYNMTKTFWSMLDPREIDLRWIGYMASIYGIEINEDFLDEVALREWVENMPYFLKRLGTYDAIYVVWKLVKTNNNLNVYERWGEWCTQDVSGTIDVFNDYHFLQFYGQTPSGGAGAAYYGLYDPVYYPTHATSPPNTGCTGINRYDCGSKLNYFAFRSIDLTSISSIEENKVVIDGYDHNTGFTQILALSAQNYGETFIDCVNITMHSPTSASNIVFWAISNEAKQLALHTSTYIATSFERSTTGNIFWKISEGIAGVEFSNSQSFLKYYPNVAYYTTIQKSANHIYLKIYSRGRRWDEDLIETITLPIILSTGTIYTVLHAINGIQYAPQYGTWDGEFSGHFSNAEYTLSIPISGYPVITPHDIVEIDLSTEPVGENYDDTWIMNETTIDELIRNWEYVRPVSKYSHYRELVAPSATIDRIGNSVPLYDLSFQGYLNTFFTGSQYISAGIENRGEQTYVHFQQFSSTTWTITHNLDSEFILIQPWIFDDLTEVAKFVEPKDVQIGDSNTVQLTFEESVRGVATVAGNISGASGVGITYINTSPLSASDFIGGYELRIDHNLSSNTPSAYGNPGDQPGVVYQVFGSDGYKIRDNTTDITEATFNRLTSVFASGGQGIPSGGGYLIRRSDYIHSQNDPANVWTINHGLNGFVIVQFYNLVDNYREFQPAKVEAINSNTLKIYWGTETDGVTPIRTRGFAHIIETLRDRVNYSPYSCDILGLGMCPDTLGYWKIGTGTNDVFNPYVANDLEIPVASGPYKAIYEDANTGYIDFEVPDTVEDVSITEVGLFNYLDQLIFYTRCSELFKPLGTSCYFHYRVAKLSS